MKQRKILFEIEFKGRGTWGAYKKATNWIYNNGYGYGSTCIGNGVAIQRGEYTLPQKMKNFRKQDYKYMDGIMVSDNFRNGTVKIQLYTLPKKCYISGKITGMPLEDAKIFFKYGSDKMNLLGYESVNPMTLKHKRNATWEDFMRVDIKALCDCDAILMLPNWRQSRGAKIEYRIAKDLGLEIKFLSKL